MMETRTVSPQRWQTFFDSFTRIYAGSRATLEVLTDGLGAQMEVEDAPLAGISCDASGVELHFSARGGHLVHRIAHPVRVTIEEREDGMIAAIEIAEDELDTIVRLATPVASRLLPA